MDYTKDYYRILAVSPDADAVVIRAAYKALMVKYHPDRNKSAEAPGIAKSLTEAKSILDDEALRLEYDLYRLKVETSGPITDRETSIDFPNYARLDRLLAHLT